MILYLLLTHVADVVSVVIVGDLFMLISIMLISQNMSNHVNKSMLGGSPGLVVMGGDSRS